MASFNCHCLRYLLSWISDLFKKLNVTERHLGIMHNALKENYLIDSALCPWQRMSVPLCAVNRKDVTHFLTYYTS